MRRRVIGGLGSFLTTLVLAPLVPVWARGGDDYRIQRATYGTPDRNVDVTQRLRELARRDERFVLKNETFGVDPAEHRVKTLRIYATDANGRSRTFEYTEGSWVDGSQFSGWGGGDWGQGGGGDWNNNNNNRDEYKILRAQYGTSERNIDVTQRLRELARDDQRFRLRNETFGSDPHPGRPKTLRIYARSPSGRTRTFEYAEGSWVDGAQFSGWGGGNWGDDNWNGNWNDNRPDIPTGGDSGLDVNDGLRIVRADYGAGRNTWDITDRLQQRVFNGRLNVKVSNSTAGGDPANGRPKQLRITYSVNGRQRSRVLNEGEFLSLP